MEDILKSGQSVELLKELHILTVDGKLNQDSRRKLKQVNHLFHFIEPLMKDTLDNKINIIKNNIELERLKTEINLLVKIINDKTIIYKTKLTEHIKNNFNTNLYNIMSDLVNSLITI